MKGLFNKLRNVFRDEQGTETIEFALVLGLIVVVCIVIIGAVGTKVVARWTTVNSKM